MPQARMKVAAPASQAYQPPSPSFLKPAAVAPGQAMPALSQAAERERLEAEELREGYIQSAVESDKLRAEFDDIISEISDTQS